MSLTTMRRKFKRAEKPIQWMLLTVFVVGCFSFFGGYQMSTRAQAEDEVVARVNREDIPRDLYNRALQMNQERMRMSGSTNPVTADQEIQMRAAARSSARSRPA